MPLRIISQRVVWSVPDNFSASPSITLLPATPLTHFSLANIDLFEIFLTHLANTDLRIFDPFLLQKMPFTQITQWWCYTSFRPLLKCLLFLLKEKKVSLPSLSLNSPVFTFFKSCSLVRDTYTFVFIVSS